MREGRKIVRYAKPIEPVRILRIQGLLDTYRLERELAVVGALPRIAKDPQALVLL